jgi:glycosyltransferase involved in cell wall biosynthesis
LLPLPCILSPVKLSVVVISHNEEANIGRTLHSVQSLVRDGAGEIIVVDSGSTDRTVAIAKSCGANVFVEVWKGYAAQKNSALTKATGDWILSLDADEELDKELQTALAANLDGNFAGFWISRKNEFLGRWIRHGGFWPDRKLRLFRQGTGTFQDCLVHETVELQGRAGTIQRGALLHHSYPTLSDYIDHMNRYSSLGAEMAVARGQRGSFINIVLRPFFTFIYNYIFRLGFLDGREGLLLHLYHAGYVSWKYSKVWELARSRPGK